MIFAAFAAPASVAEAYGCSDYFVTVGDGHVCFWSVDAPKEKGPPYEITPRKAIWGKVPPAPKTHFAAFMPNDDVIVTASSCGNVYLWRDANALSRFEAHTGACRALHHDAKGLSTCGDDGQIKVWSKNKGKYALAQSFKPASPHAAGGSSAAVTTSAQQSALAKLKLPKPPRDVTNARDLVMSSEGKLVVALTHGSLLEVGWREPV